MYGAEKTDNGSRQEVYLCCYRVLVDKLILLRLDTETRKVLCSDGLHEDRVKHCLGAHECADHTLAIASLGYLLEECHRNLKK